MKGINFEEERRERERGGRDAAARLAGKLNTKGAPAVQGSRAMSDLCG